MSLPDAVERAEKYIKGRPGIAFSVDVDSLAALLRPYGADCVKEAESRISGGEESGSTNPDLRSGAYLSANRCTDLAAEIRGGGELLPRVGEVND